MNDLPRIKLDELLLEVSLTSRRHIVVEGASDDRFFRAWAMDMAGGERVVVTSVERIDVPAQWLIDIGLNDGNRARLVFIARRAHEASIDLRCIADRDCGHHVEKHRYATLAWTDFPALESYAVEESVLDRANLLSFAEKLPPASELLPSLAFALGELYAVRSRNEHLPKPKYQAGFKNKDRSLTSFDVAAAVDVTVRTHVPSYTRPSSSEDPRAYSYGHDVAELLLAAYGNTLKNHAGLSGRDAVEGALRSAIQAVGTYKDEPMFKGLARWVAA
jgi:hypothetical protein